jgi:hypothetical protein
MMDDRYMPSIQWSLTKLLDHIKKISNSHYPQTQFLTGEQQWIDCTSWVNASYAFVLSCLMIPSCFCCCFAWISCIVPEIVHQPNCSTPISMSASAWNKWNAQAEIIILWNCCICFLQVLCCICLPSYDPNAMQCATVADFWEFVRKGFVRTVLISDMVITERSNLQESRDEGRSVRRIV